MQRTTTTPIRTPGQRTPTPPFEHPPTITPSPLIHPDRQPHLPRSNIPTPTPADSPPEPTTHPTPPDPTWTEIPEPDFPSTLAPATGTPGPHPDTRPSPSQVATVSQPGCDSVSTRLQHGGPTWSVPFSTDFPRGNRWKPGGNPAGTQQEPGRNRADQAGGRTGGDAGRRAARQIRQGLRLSHPMQEAFGLMAGGMDPPELQGLWTRNSAGSGNNYGARLARCLWRIACAWRTG